MENDKVEISQRLVACKHFRWMPGMRTLGDWRIINVDSDGVEVVTDLSEVVLFHSGDLPHIPSSLPDLTDPATLGCLLSLVREHWGSHAMTVANGFEEPHEVWSVHDGRFSEMNYGHEISRGAAEAEALVAALEATP